MASQLYPKARERFLTAQMSWLVGTYKAVLLPDSYVPDFDDEFLSDIFEGVRVAISEEITGRTATDGFANSDPIPFGTLADPRQVSKIIIFRDTGVESASPLVAFVDRSEVQGAPIELIGFEYFFIPSAFEGGIFRL